MGGGEKGWAERGRRSPSISNDLAHQPQQLAQASLRQVQLAAAPPHLPHGQRACWQQVGRSHPQRSVRRAAVATASLQAAKAALRCVGEPPAFRRSMEAGGALSSSRVGGFASASRRAAPLLLERQRLERRVGAVGERVRERVGAVGADVAAVQCEAAQRRLGAEEVRRRCGGDVEEGEVARWTR